MRNLTWLASYPKSGNTWVRMFVAAYLANSETFDLLQVNQFSRSDSLLSLFAEIAGKPTTELTDEDIDTHRLAVQERLAHNIGQRVVKTHNARVKPNGQRQVFSRFTKAGICIVRNPLDIVDSLADHTNYSNDAAIELMNEPGHRLGRTDKHAAQLVGTWSHHVRTWINNDNEFPLIVLRYEDLKENPLEHFSKLIEFLGWDYDEQRVRRAVELTSFQSLQQAEQADGFAEESTVARSGRFFRHGESGRWRTVLTARQAAQVIIQHREVMEMLGYEVAGHRRAVPKMPAAKSNGAEARRPAPSAKDKLKPNESELLASSPTGLANSTTQSDARITAYEIYPQTEMPLTSAPINRQWMDDTEQRYAYRCLPLTLANQAGWVIANPTGFTVYWNGGPGPKDVILTFDNDRPEKRISGLFGHGVVTFNMPYLFRTPENINLWVKGPTNSPKDGIHALEGIVETDWTVASFTMNWKLTRANHVIRFEAGEPICMVVPFPRGLIDSLSPHKQSLDSAPEVAQAYRRWSADRDEFHRLIASGDVQAIGRGWQKDYFQGRDPGRERFDTHQTKLIVRPFA
ncbi:MAG: sulfotransferase domain-containing protein [Planctomycetes bacterium]|nr:sulfotransferase domain-containing protein [Planctomycetota bacterium]